MQNEQEITSTIIAMERAALDRWGNGDPSGFLEISAPDVVYFDPHREKRVDGLETLTALYESIRGMVHVDCYELLNPLVQICGDIAVLTFNYVSYSGQNETRWNCTEVYRCDADRWQIIQTHWSYTRHPGIVQG
jgi:ketosteroid isomerase-like protein